MIASIFAAIAAVPKILDYLEQFAQWISTQVALARDKQLANDMNKAVDKAKNTKDTSDIDNLFGGKS